MKFLFFFLSFFLVHGPFCEGSQTRVIILGFDGVDTRLAEKYMDQGQLPNLAKLRESGTYLPLGTTLPPQSPVSWSSFGTGQNPGKTRIFDFLMRMPGSYYPDFAMLGEGKIALLPRSSHRVLASALVGLFIFGIVFFLLRRGKKRKAISMSLGVFSLLGTLLLLMWIPKEIPKPVLRRAGVPFWQRVSRQGIPSVMIRMPVTFPPEHIPHGKLLSGLGVPDVRKTIGTFSFYTAEETGSADAADTEMGGKIIPVQIHDGKIRTFVWGPKNFTKEGAPDVLPELNISIDQKTKQCTLQFQGQSHTLKEREWSPWFTFRFDMNPLVHLYGIGRFYLVSVQPVFQLYLGPINFHPAKVPPNFSLSSPRDYSKDLVKAVGLYKTVGWMEETWGLNERRLDEKAFLEDLFETEKTVREIMFHELAKPDWRLFVGIFEGTDRVQHMFWRTIDPKHPAYTAEDAAAYGDAILRVYRRMDQTVGEVLEKFTDEDTILFVISDHGFVSFRRAVNLNTWLVKKGYMTLKDTEGVRDRNLKDLFDRGEFWPNVDWSKTKAYAMGLAGLYINLRGREPEGIVFPHEYEALRRQIIKDLLALEDPKTGIRPLVNVYRRDEVYSGPYFEETPDLITGFQAGYRTSWQTALGGIPREVFEDNKRKWSGDHCSYDPSVLPGVFFCNRKLPEKQLHIMDVAPTVLEIFDVPIPSEMDGTSFWTQQ
ncbi:MAG: alkaline phosphatase family protein [Candidatus Omnitrophota bacterium]